MPGAFYFFHSSSPNRAQPHDNLMQASAFRSHVTDIEINGDHKRGGLIAFTIGLTLVLLAVSIAFLERTDGLSGPTVCPHGLPHHGYCGH